MDIHRKQLTLDNVEAASGRWERGRVAPADREHLAKWLARFDGVPDVQFAMEGCTGWRYVAEEMRAAGVIPHLAEPAETAALRGRKRRAKTDRADAQHLRRLLAEGRLPGCYIPPSSVLEWRALIELYHDLRAQHSGWAQRVQAVCFHHGTTAPGTAGVIRGDRQRLRRIVEEQLSPVGRLQVNTALTVMDALDVHIERLRRRLLATARHVHGARVLMHEIYGVGGMTSLALCAWLGGAGATGPRFGSARKAVRFVGLDITVHSSDNKRSSGRLSRHGPQVLRWLLFEAAKTSARGCAPGHGHYATVRDRIDANRATLSQARRIVRHAVHLLTDLGDEAFTIVAQPAAPSTIAR
ncbi:MAG TPA: transposase [Micromonosporaceae bacterium]|nr:transposase [Micromonosporaceae bacterium]